MFENSKIEQQNNSKKDNQSQFSLQKIIKLDCRDSNFLFRDQSRNQFDICSRYFRVHYPHTSTDVSPGQHLLKRFWMHVEAHYFKKLDKDELYRFDYVKQIFNEQIENGRFLMSDQQFHELLDEIFSAEVLQSMSNEGEMCLDKKNLLNRLYIIWIKSQIKFTQRDNKIIQKKLSESLNHFFQTKNKKTILKSLNSQQTILNQLLSSHIINGKKKQTFNQIQNQIFQLQNQLHLLSQNNSKTLSKISQSIQNQFNHQNKNYLPLETQNKRINKKNDKSKKFRRSQLETVSEQIHTNIDLQEIQFIIRNLQQRQLAQSMSKILECRKINGQYYYLVGFEQAMYVQPKLFCEKEIFKLNKLRQTSLFQFYRTGVKSLYSYTCQNYAGFSELAHNRQNLSKFKIKDIFDLMKKNPNLSPKILQSFNKFSTCHHCKFLYPDYLMKTCKFTSDRQALPKNNYQATLDPDFSQLLHSTGQAQKGRISQRFTTRKKNCLTGYSKINQEYVCGRRYCFSCLKDCYPNQLMNESIFCPFCQGNCACSRCLRNQKIVKFRNAFTLLGGDFTILSLQSCLQKLQTSEDNLLPKRRGRPKKFTRKQNHIAINRVQKKMRIGLKTSDIKLNDLSHGRNFKIKLSTKKDKVNKKRLMLNRKSLNLLHPRRRRGRPPKDFTQPIKKCTKLQKNQVDPKQIENIFLSMTKQ